MKMLGAALLLLLLFGTKPTVGFAHEAQSFKGISLRKFLKPDGSLNLPPHGIRGGLDVTGYRLISRQGEPPRFALAENILTAGDENWDPRFGLGDLSDSVFALAWDGMNFYVGGTFT